MTDSLLDFWFGPQRASVPDPATRKAWFQADAEIDSEVTRRFAERLSQAPVEFAQAIAGNGPEQLAFIILCDQIPRHIHRGTARAFDYDHLAQDVCRRGLEKGLDIALAPVQRAFFYMPLEHHEWMPAQKVSVQMQTKLLDLATNELERELQNGFCRAAVEHAAIIERFGRFPHRNAVLQRENSDEELAYLQDHASRFGQ